VQKNSSSLEALAFGHSAYNTNNYDIEGQHAVLNKLTHASEVSTTRGQHIIGSSSKDPMMVQSNSPGWVGPTFPNGANNTNYFGLQHDAMNNLTCVDQVSNNQVATWTRGEQETTSLVPPMTVQNTSHRWEVFPIDGSACNKNYYVFDGQQVPMNNITGGQPW